MNIRTTFRKYLARTAVAGTVLASLGVVAQTSPAFAGTSCSSTLDCINAIKVTQELPVDVAIPTIKFSTTVPTKATMKIMVGGSVVATRAESSYATNHTWWYLNGLQQGTSYTFAVTVVAQDGSSRGESTTFRAMQRKVVVVIDKVTIQNDSDPIGSGELQVFAQAAGQFIGATGEVSKGDGGTITVGKSVTINKAKSQVRIDVVVRDNDCTGICYLPPLSQWKAIDQTDWEQGAGNKVLTGLQLPGWASDVPFTFTGSGPVKFTVYGHYSLSVG